MKLITVIAWASTSSAMFERKYFSRLFVVSKLLVHKQVVTSRKRYKIDKITMKD